MLCRVPGLAALLLSLPAICAGADYDFGVQPAVILLKNGSTLRGQITPAGDRYVVSFGMADVVRIPVDRVAKVCRSLAEAYQFKRGAISDSLQDRIELAQWCVEEGMHAQAADQLLAAELRHGRQPPIEWLHQRLLRSAVGRALTESASSRKTVADRVDSQAVLEDLSSTSVAEFHSTVQPLLMNRCAATGCHGGRGKSDYVLLRPRRGRPLTRRMTERNLLATLEHANREAVDTSRLLVNARKAHGQAESPPILIREAAYLSLLKRWIQGLDSKSPARPNQVASRNEVLYQTAPQRPGDSSLTPAAVKKQSTPQAEEQEPSLPASAYQPRDPFDPEVFNRRYHSSDKQAGDKQRDKAR